jgi:hypothetical protein
MHFAVYPTACTWSNHLLCVVSLRRKIRHWNADVRDLDYPGIKTLDAASTTFYSGDTYAWQLKALEAAKGVAADAGDDAVRKAMQDGMPEDIKRDLAAFEAAVQRCVVLLFVLDVDGIYAFIWLACSHANYTPKQG